MTAVPTFGVKDLLAAVAVAIKIMEHKYLDSMSSEFATSSPVNMPNTDAAMHIARLVSCAPGDADAELDILLLPVFVIQYHNGLQYCHQQREMKETYQ
jgi:hypothetical protein